MAEAPGSRRVVTADGASGREGQPVHQAGGPGFLSKVFALNPAGLNWARAVMVLDMLMVPLVLFWAIGHQEYLLSAVFGLIFAVAADPGGSYGNRAWHVAVFALIGAGLTALGFAIGAEAWGWLVLAAGKCRAGMSGHGWRARGVRPRCSQLAGRRRGEESEMDSDIRAAVYKELVTDPHIDADGIVKSIVRTGRPDEERT